MPYEVVSFIGLHYGLLVLRHRPLGWPLERRRRAPSVWTGAGKENPSTRDRQADSSSVSIATMECTERKIQGAHGLSLNLVEWSRDGVPILLLHGYSNEAHIWDDFVPVVSSHYRVLALDLRGHGESDWHPEGAYRYEDHVEDVEAVVEALGIDRIVVVGHSLGGRIACSTAGATPTG